MAIKSYLDTNLTASSLSSSTSMDMIFSLIKSSTITESLAVISSLRDKTPTSFSSLSTT